MSKSIKLNIPKGTYEQWRSRVIALLWWGGLIKRKQEVAEDIYKCYYDDDYEPVRAIKEDLGEDACNNLHPNHI